VRTTKRVYKRELPKKINPAIQIFSHRMNTARLILFLCFLIVTLGASVPLNSIDEEGEDIAQQQHQGGTIHVEHALEPGVFTHRGSATLGGLRGESAKLTQNSLSAGELAQLNVCVRIRCATRPHATSRNIT
jgi:hypothetical protein